LSSWRALSAGIALVSELLAREVAPAERRAKDPRGHSPARSRDERRQIPGGERHRFMVNCSGSISAEHAANTWRRRPPTQGWKTFRNHADNGRFSPCVVNSFASISAVFWLPAGFADGGGNARTQEILRALDQLAISRPSGPKSLTKSEHGRPLSSINCSDMVSISNCPRQLNSSHANWKDSSILPSQKCSTR
jgi:hypothetical protein